MTTPGESPQDIPKAPMNQSVPPTPSAERDSFFGALFDFSFQRYATPSVARVLYLLVFIAVGVLGLLTIVGLIGGLFSGTGAGILAFVIGVPFVVLFAVAGLALYRVYLEVAVSLIRTSQSVQAIDARQAESLMNSSEEQWPRGVEKDAEKYQVAPNFPAVSDDLPDGFREQFSDDTQYPGFGTQDPRSSE